MGFNCGGREHLSLEGHSNRHSGRVGPLRRNWLSEATTPRKRRLAMINSLGGLSGGDIDLLR
eukprot:6842451-Alexandrium_andersonii.AAC.1